MIINGKECSCANCGNRKVLEEYMETEDGHFQGKRTCEGFACIDLIQFKDGHIVWMHDENGMCEMWKLNDGAKMTHRSTECYNCGFWNNDYEGCTCPSVDKWYACPLEPELKEEDFMTVDEVTK